MTATPGFPRRGIPIPKRPLPARPEPAPPFHKTAIGRRLVLYAVILVAVVGMMAGVKISDQMHRHSNERFTAGSGQISEIVRFIEEQRPDCPLMGYEIEML